MLSFIPKVSNLSPRVIRVLGCNPGPMTLQGTNTYILGTGKRRILLDTGEENNDEYLSSLNKVLESENICLEHIVITHWHLDHIGGLLDVLKTQKNGCTAWKFRREGTEAKDTSKAGNLKWLEDGQEITAEGVTLSVRHTPGHTTDHVALVLKEENAVFSGDCILGEGTAVFENLKDYMESLQKLLEIHPNIIYPGHGAVVEDPAAKIKEYIHHRHQRESQILNILGQSEGKEMSEIDIVRILYKDVSEKLHGAAAVNVNHHLMKLLHEKKVVQLEKGWKMSERDKE